METKEYYKKYAELKGQIAKDIQMSVDLIHKGHYEFENELIFVDLQPKHYDEASRFRVLSANNNGIVVEDVYSQDSPLQVELNDFEVSDLIFILEQL